MMRPWKSLFGGGLTLLIAFFLSEPDALAQSCVEPSPNIVAWWPFDEVVGIESLDIKGVNDGIHVGDPEPTSGLVGGSLRFDGIDDYVSVPDSDLWAFGTQEFSIEFWANFDTPAHGSRGHPGDVFISNDEGPFNIPKWFFALNSSTLDFLTCCGPGWAFSPNAPFSPVVGSWYHLAVTRAGTDYRIYVDGQLVEADANSAIIPNIDSILTIGRALEPFGGFMNGRLDEMTVYNRALSADEIESIFDAGSEGKCKAPLIRTPSEFAIVLGSPHSQQFEVRLGQPPFSWSVIGGELPAGMDLHEDGTFSGTPTELGSSIFTAELIDNDGNVAEQEFNVEVVLLSPPPNVRFHKVGTIPVPGRNVDYFVSVENAGSTTEFDLEILEILHPVSFYNVLSVGPEPRATNEMTIFWTIPSLDPGDTKIFTYSVELNPTIQFGTRIPGGVFVGGPGEAEEASISWAREVGNSSCKANSIECQTLLAICASPGCHPFSNLSACSSCPRTWEVCTAGCDHCDLFPDQFRVVCDDATGPIDPNEKLVLSEMFIRADQSLVYPIHFENIGEIEAIDVFITDVLDPNLDASTLEIRSPGASYDPITRTLRWNLLGRNLQAGETDNVVFSVRPLPDLPSGTEIRNSAEIQFEVFEPLVTEEVVNVIDGIPPECVMDALPSETKIPVGMGSTLIPISWNGSDEVGEIDTYSVFVAENGGGFAPLVESTEDTSVDFGIALDTTYEFFCAAVDTAGNVEVQDLVAETQTKGVAGLASVPDVVGFTQQEALDSLTAAGLNSVSSTDSSETVLSGDVISQVPTGGAEVAPGSIVALVISTGPAEGNPFDVNGDGVVDGLDINAIVACYGQPAACNPNADVNDDETINILDISLVANNFT